MFSRLSELVAAQVPCFFYTDFIGKQLICHPIDDLDSHDIEFSFENIRSTNNKPHKPLHYPVSLDTYRTKFESVQEEIRDGNTYLLNLTQPTPIETPYSLHEIYQLAHAPYKMRVKNEFVCFSPEPFISIIDNTIHAYPMKGTIDASLPDAMKTIINDPKEIAEHTMIVDLLRNDLGIIGKEIRVEKFRYITTIDTGEKKLHQVSSHISGKLNPSWKENAGDLIQKLLPAGSISGTPKRKTVEIIQQIENYNRGFFTGIFGHYDGESLHTAVAIRFIEKTPDGYIYKSGGGITAESECIKEYDEMIDKIYIP